MSPTASVTIHESQFPEAVRRDLLESLRRRKVNHKFHYDSVKQTQKWLALHQQYSPSRNDDNCRAIYQNSFDAVAETIKSKAIHLIGLGCGGGQKDTQLLKSLKTHGRKLFYTPCDVSSAMVLVARKAALAAVPDENCFPFVCDLGTAADLRTAFLRITHHASRIITFFGMIPNFEPPEILPKLASLVGRNDVLLFSANLAPGKEYAAGVKQILPQYDNPATREWLMTFLLDLGVEQRDGQLEFSIEAGAFGLKRIVAWFHFQRDRTVKIENDSFTLRKGESIRLFFSYRYTSDRVRKILNRYGLAVADQWITDSEEEGVFLCRKR